jgi:hypothetical protein
MPRLRLPRGTAVVPDAQQQQRLHEQVHGNVLFLSFFYAANPRAVLRVPWPETRAQPQGERCSRRKLIMPGIALQFSMARR